MALLSTLLCLALATASSKVLFERTAAPPGWKVEGRVDSTKPYGILHLPLMQSRPDELKERVLEISNPDHASYGKFLTKERVLDFLTPTEATTSAVSQWLESCSVGAKNIDKSGVDVWKLNATVANVECLFSARVFHCTELNNGRQHIAAMGPVHLPAGMSQHVPFVPGISDFPLPRQSKAKRNLAETAGGKDKGVISPKTLASLYNIESALYPAQATLLVAEFDIGGGPSSYTPAYLFGGGTDKDPGFYNLAGIPQQEAKSAKNVGPFKSDDGELEANLDMQYGASTARGAALVYWTEEKWMYEFATNLFNGVSGVSAKDVDVVSISFAWSEAHQCLQPTGKPNPECTKYKVTTPEYVDRVNTEFAKIGALGTTIVVSAGDDGAPGNLGKCDGKLLDSLFPAASTFVTTVGGTMLMTTTETEGETISGDPICTDNKGCAKSTHQVVCTYPQSGITSGGGFSVFSPMPAWQQSAVDAYLKKGKLPSSALFNASNRAYPDVALVSDNYAVYAGTVAAAEANGDAPYHFWIPTDGTSASTPVVAGMLTLVKSHLGRRLGFLSPTLYKIAASHPAAFTDITEGSNKCRSTCCGPEGYGAAKGWDATTGLGTINVKELLVALAKIDNERNVRVIV